MQRRVDVTLGHRVGRPWLPLLFFALIAIGMTLTAPHRADFWWSDAPRHALNGVFLMDLFRDLPITDPVGYAKAYYAQYPALSILFYPPLFPLTEVPVYAVFGVSHLSAQLTVGLYWFFLLWGVWRLGARFLPGYIPLVAVMLFASVHELAFWGRQVMLEIPAATFLAWAAVMYLRFLDSRATHHLFGLVALSVLALYTKQTTAFLVLAIAVMLVWETRGQILSESRLWTMLALAALALLPLAALTLKFGMVNVNAVLGETGQELSRLSLANWLYYPSKLLEQVGWPVLGLSIVYVLGRLAKRDWRLPGPEARLLVAWLLFGYIFFSLIGLKETRHTSLVLLPLPLFATVALYRLVPAKIAAQVSIGLAAGCLGYTLFLDPVPNVAGYARAAEYVAAHAPKNSTVLFSGYRDGSFVFNMRSHGERGDLSTLRSDKLLLKVKVKRELGVQQRELTQAELAQKLNDYGVSYVVNQPNFWTDLSAMRMLQNLLHSPQFVLVSKIPTAANVHHDDHVLEIYRNVGYTPGQDNRPRLDLLIIDETI